MKTNGFKTAANAPKTNVCLSSCRKILGQIERVRAGIQREFRDAVAEHAHLLELAVNEAEALAWQSGFPQLMFPTLAAEKARSVAHWHARQQSMRRRVGRGVAVV